MEGRWTPPNGVQGNAWSAAATGAGGFSSAIDTGSMPFVAAFGNSDGATTLTLQVSQDGTNYYDSQLTQVLAGAGNFCILGTVAARYVRLKSSANVTVTATISTKW